MKKFMGLCVIVILIVMNTFCVSGQVNIPETIKVGIIFGNKEIDNIRLEGDSKIIIVKDGDVINEGSTFILKKDDGNTLKVIGKNGDDILQYDVKKDKVYFKGDKIIKVNGKTYRGSIMVDRYYNSDLTIINELKMDEYLYGVLPKEIISKSWPLEAQKAQAVAARNFALVKLGLHKDLGFDLCNSTHCQVYGGFSVENSQSNRAVDETSGQVLTYNGQAISTYYHSNSGGKTENMENVWSKAVEYIKSVEDPYSIGAPNDSWEKSYSKYEIENILNNGENHIGKLKSIKIKNRADSGRVTELEIIGDRDKIILQKDKIRKVFGYNNIKSTWFNIKHDGDRNKIVLQEPYEESRRVTMENVYVISDKKTMKVEEQLYIHNGETTSEINFENVSDDYLFVGRGWGHGLGMSQWGAKKMAEEGFSYEEILKFYYKNILLER
ncbi:MAG: SpoIID/LytB domain-containing protein [Anaeromicrobium sp.]|uniref:SpoIID/LytB domain-containing protein n=1 Tax=Anaeromicrobium sp. TaxID=1929132 RepID=UPI0025F1AE8D|nr:SpoIID/LytB domain-containing protein [Anaeromicrobium sp.]MCT4594843.1 SpoIID/LytB domain-containing protein [Anaeromicrobium sp.]